MLWVRNVRDRLTKLAPFLSYDGDPYPVVVDGRVLWVVDAYTTTSHYPYAQRVGNEVQLTRDSGLPATPTTSATASRRSSTPTTGRSASTSPTRRPDHQGVAGRVRRPVHAGGPRCRRAAPAPPLPRGPVPGADRRLLEVPARPGALLRARGGVVGGPGAERRPAGVDDARTPRRRRRGRAAAPELASESSANRFIPYYTMFADRRGRAPSSCCCGPSCRSPATTSAPSCRRT